LFIVFSKNLLGAQFGELENVNYTRNISERNITKI